MIATRPLYTLADYEAVEQGSEVKHEFVGGVILAMAGGTVEHGRLSLNFAAELRLALRGSDCTALSSDVRIGHAKSTFRAYPDVSVLCGSAQYAEHPPNTVTNPTIIVEILSESTANYDQGAKLESYKRIPSVRAVVFVSQEAPAVRVHLRAEPEWELAEFARGDSFILPCVPAPLAVDDIYA